MEVGSQNEEGQNGRGLCEFEGEVREFPSFHLAFLTLFHGQMSLFGDQEDPELVSPA